MPGETMKADPAVDLSEAISALGDDVHETKRAKGWAVTTMEDWPDQHRIPAVLALIHSEVSEAMEAFRGNDINGFAEECGDILIRLVGLTHGMGIDLGKEAWAKATKNKARAFQHGGKKL